MTDWDYYITLFDGSGCPTKYAGDMYAFCRPGQACVPLVKGWGMYAYEVNSNPYGISSWAHAGLSSTLSASYGG